MWIYQNDLETGICDLPKISKNIQAKARKNKELEWVKIGREIVYRKEWVQRWLESNIRPAKTLQENE
ncbi:conserved hypothetical protein [Sulfurovum sp. enrichment culture clone C5]|uniref:Helix-turn-helix domain-containing protein n=1 Tax=Sulfurovum sp. enrichment culture clone C5 TaxID=497650 RepID=A0A0S4XPF7_9BACT|nr:conserved hypothetical protein [Sulfurovum sp. enrichment culture clone C5]